MAKLNTRKYLIYGSIAAIVGVLGYYIWKGSKKPNEPKNDGVIDDGLNDGNLKDGNAKDKSNSNIPTAEQKALATDYRKWANSTDALSKKWGKQSTHNLDATGDYNSFFLSSYNAGGKAEYEAYLKESKAPIASANKAMFDFLVNQNTNAVTTSKNGIRQQIIYFKSWGYSRAVLELREQTSLTDKKPYWNIYGTQADKTANRGLKAQGYWSVNPNTKEFTFKSTGGVGAGRTKTNKLIKVALEQVLGTQDFQDIQWIK